MDSRENANGPSAFRAYVTSRNGMLSSTIVLSTSGLCLCTIFLPGLMHWSAPGALALALLILAFQCISIISVNCYVRGMSENPSAGMAPRSQYGLMRYLWIAVIYVSNEIWFLFMLENSVHERGAVAMFVRRLGELFAFARFFAE